MSRHEHVLLDGAAGAIEVFVEPHDAAAGIALIAHPHPLYGGTADNKVVTTLARTFRELGYATLRSNSTCLCTPAFRRTAAGAGRFLVRCFCHDAFGEGSGRTRRPS